MIETITQTSSYNNTIIILTQDEQLYVNLKKQTGYFGYQIIRVNDQESLQNVLARDQASIVIIDLDNLQNREPTSDSSLFRLLKHTSISVLTLSSQSNMPDRLTSVRIGARAFLVKPVIVARLIEYLDALTSQQSDEAYRVLIVDDQPLLAATHETVLRQSGMLVSTVTNPLRIFSAMGFVPDLILIDLYMPGCTGVELVAVLRQVDAYIDIPMVYLSAETHLNRQMAALAQGGDDFLTKPIQLDHLVQAVTHRIERTREKRRTLLSRQLRTSAIVDNSISWRPLRVFLCHSKHDKEMARTLYRNLRQMQFQPWLDEEDILPGQDWEQEIREAVHKADVVVICLSQASVTSTGYMHKEVRFALDAAEYQPEKSIFMIPVRLDDCTVPSRLERWQWVNLYEGTGYQQLMKALQRQQAFLTTE